MPSLDRNVEASAPAPHPGPLPVETGRGGETDWRASLPFPAHWLWYIGTKLLVLALVIGFALYWYGLI